MRYDSWAAKSSLAMRPTMHGHVNTFLFWLLPEQGFVVGYMYFTRKYGGLLRDNQPTIEMTIRPVKAQR